MKHDLFNIGCVSYLNSKPLIEPLINHPDVVVHFAVPSRLLELITSGQVCAALLPIVDYQASPVDLLLIPAGGIACDGPTLTVRIFSRVPPQHITRLYTDTDSHTSAVLAQLILREFYGVNPLTIPLGMDTDPHARNRHETLLLIGDKVVNTAPPAADFPWQLDLGEQWKRFTGLPFVFAMWMVRSDVATHGLPELLKDARRKGREMTEELIERYADQRGWPPNLARDYFTRHLEYNIKPAAKKGIEKFFALAQQHHLLDIRRPLRYLNTAEPTDVAADHVR